MSDPKNDVRLVVNGQEFGGWKSVKINPGIEFQARKFELSVTDKWPGQTNIPRRIRPFDACQVYIGQDLVLTGWVDATPIRYDGRSVSVGVKGRSKTCDLVDCCPIERGQATGVGNKKTAWGDVKGPDGKTVPATVVRAPSRSANQWRGMKLETIAAALAAPYGVRVLAEVDTGRPIPSHQVQVGETVFESIDRMMRIRHVLSTDNEKGDLVFIDVGSGGRATTMIELGKNARGADAPLDYSGVYSTYIVKGQRSGSDTAYAQDVCEEEGIDDEEEDSADTSPSTSTSVSVAQDSRSKRRRVLVMKQCGQADEGTCQDRAEYERAHRAAKALETVYTVGGWRQDSGVLWLPNLIVRVRDPLVGFDADFVTAEVTWILDEHGQRTDIRVGPPDGYRTKAAKQKKAKSRKGAGSWGDIS